MKENNQGKEILKLLQENYEINSAQDLSSALKNMFKDACLVNDNVKGLASLKDNEQEFKLVTRKPITSDEQELNRNNRAHSAKLRIIEKL